MTVRGALPRAPARDLDDHLGPPAGTPPGRPPSARGRRAAGSISPSLAAEPAPAPCGQRLAEGLDVVQPRRQQERQRGADQQVVDVAAHLLVEPGHLLVVEHRAVGRARARGPPGSRRRPAGPGRRSRASSSSGSVVGCWSARSASSSRASVRSSSSSPAWSAIACHSSSSARGRRRRGCRGAGRPSTTPAPADDPLVPPVGRLHLLAPGPAGVPVVADVVVVEDHRARQRRQQPAVRRVAPGQPVEVGVLLVVLQLGPRRLARGRAARR